MSMFSTSDFFDDLERIVRDGFIGGMMAPDETHEAIFVEYPIERFEDGRIAVGMYGAHSEQSWRDAAEKNPDNPIYRAIVEWADHRPYPAQETKATVEAIVLDVLYPSRMSDHAEADLASVAIASRLAKAGLLNLDKPET